ncbi:MAG: 30S ribosomal protein S18 [Pseudomonadota bacterium]
MKKMMMDDRKNKKKKMYHRRKVCRFCAERSLEINYKDIRVLRNFVTERGKLVPRRISGNCARHQRQMTTAVKRARHMALMPYTAMVPSST